MGQERARRALNNGRRQTQTDRPTDRTCRQAGRQTNRAPGEIREEREARTTLAGRSTGSRQRCAPCATCCRRRRLLRRGHGQSRGVPRRPRRRRRCSCTFAEPETIRPSGPPGPTGPGSRTGCCCAGCGVFFVVLLTNTGYDGKIPLHFKFLHAVMCCMFATAWERASRGKE